jgi:hypothetical protein
VDFESIWKKQDISPVLIEALTMAAKVVHDSITDTPPTVSNVTEWAKQQACWKRVAGLKIDWPKALLNELESLEDQRKGKRDAIKGQKMLNGIDAQRAVVMAGGDFWHRLLDWGAKHKLLTPMEIGILQTAAAIPRKIPTDKQSLVAVDALRKLQGEGCQMTLEPLNVGAR